jgi:hypothetical protein
MELVAASVASAFLLAGMGSVMYIARQVAYTPHDATRRSQAANIVGQICDELRYASVVIQQTSRILEFVVADRNSDGAAEKIRYEWSGTLGHPLRKTVNGGTAVDVLPSVNSFNVVFQQKSSTTTVTTKTESAETLLLANGAVQTGSGRDIDVSNHMSQVLLPMSFPSVPANAISWNATKVEFHGRQNGAATETLAVQIRSSSDFSEGPTSHILGQASIAESSLSPADGWNTITFPNPVRDLIFHRYYQLAFVQVSGSGKAARVTINESAPTGITDSTDAGATWQYMPTRQMYGRVYGTYTTPGSSYDVMRNYVSSVRIALQTGSQSAARIDASAPLPNLPELLTTYWRTDFDRNPTTTNSNGDAVSDWALAGGGAFDTTKLSGGTWTATGAIETRPLADFITTTTVEVRCRNTGTGGNGAVTCINADRQGGQYAPLLVFVQRQSDGTQTLTLNGKTSDAATKKLFTRTNLPSGFVRYRLTILPANNLVNLQINDEDQGTYTYPTYAPSSANDRYLTLYADTSAAEFDYVDVRVGTN